MNVSGQDLSGLAAEQAALRRVATLVAGGAAPEEVFAAITEEVGRLLPVDYVHMGRYEPDDTLAVVGSWGTAGPDASRTVLGGRNLGTIVFETGRSARIDSYADASGPLGVAAHESGIRSAVGTPITVEGRLWGAMVASTHEEQTLPADAETRLASFTELLATTIANAESRAGVTRLAADQAALRRVATLVARGVPSQDVFAAVVEEVGRLLPVDFADLGRCEPDGTVTFVAAWGKTSAVFPVGARLRLGGTNVTTLVAQTGRPARIDSYADASGSIGAPTRETGVSSAVGTPITVDGHLWGVMAAGWSLEEPMPADTEPRLAQFTDLLETAIANAESRAGLARLAEEQAALRRVATLVAGGAAPEEVFAAITEEVGQLLPVDFADMSRCEPDGAVTFVAAWGTTAAVFPIGSRWIPEGNNLCSIVARTGRPARIESYAEASGPIDVAVRGTGVHSGVGTPIVVDGRLWGVMAAGSSREEPMPADTEARLTLFTELLATAVANAESRAGLARLADEQAALRRVATLVAEDVPSSELFRAVAREVGTLLGADFSGMIRFEDDATVSTVAAWAAVGEHPPVPDRWPTEPGDPATMIAETRQPARVEDWAAVPGPIAAVIREELGVSSSVGCPIMVEGRLWGALAVHSKQPVALPPDTEARAAQFADLVATAIGNAEARAEVARLAREQAALRRVATLVAREASQAEVFTAIAEEIGQLLGAEEIRVMRYEDERSAVVVAGTGELEQAFSIGSHHPLEGESAISRVFRTGRPVRIDDYGTVSGPVADTARSIGVHCVLATPVVVEGRLWGAMVTGTTRDEPVPPETESRLGQFTELMATAIANTESHARAERLSDEQAALRRVATLVAQGVPPAEIFSAVSDEIGRLFGAHSAVVRFEPQGPAIVLVGVGSSLEGLPVGAHWELDDSMASTEVYRTGRSARVGAIDWSSRSGPLAEAGQRLGVVSTIACPIIVEGRRWGAVTVSSMDEPLVVGLEERLENFTDLVATAIGNAEAREARGRLTDEQAALRRVATLVAEGASPTAVFDAVAGEMEALLDADQVALNRFEPGDEITVLAHRGLDSSRTPVGSRVSLDGESVTATVRRTARPARMENFEGATGTLAELARATGERSSVGAPIVVDGRLWGIITASWKGEHPPAPGTEDRMAQFAELLDTAIANADSRDQLTASRARLLTAGDEARRRVVRDLHDGAQQRLVHTIVRLKLAQRASEEDDGEAASLIGEALEQAELGHAELRELAHGILPGALTRGGLRAGVDAMVARLDLPVQVHVPTERLPAEIEASAYFIVAEALTNVVKHAQAGRAEVRASVNDGMLYVAVRDDGIGSADPDGHGLVAMADRVTALGGRLEIESPAGDGTLLAATLPLSAG